MASFDKFGFERNKEKADMSDLESKIAALEANGMSVKNIFPKSYIFLTFDSNFDPNKVFTGTQWTRVKSGKVLVNFNGSDNDFNAPKKEGGAKRHGHGSSSERLTINQIPNHVHGVGNHTHTFFFNQNSPNGLDDIKWHGSENTDGFKKDRSIYVEYHETDSQDPSTWGYWRATWRLNQEGNEFGKLNIRKLKDFSSALRTGDVSNVNSTTTWGVWNRNSDNGHSHTIYDSSNMPPYIVCYMWERVA